jgi:hypothetical protein
VEHRQPIPRRLQALFRQRAHRAVDGLKEALRIVREPAGQRQVGIRPVFGEGGKPGLSVHRRIARDQVVQRRTKRIEVGE